MNKLKTFERILKIFAVLLILNLQLSAQVLRFWSPGVDIFYGSRISQNSFYNQVNTFDQINLSNPLEIIGIDLSDHFLSGAGGEVRQVSFTQILPHAIKLQDSINCNITGFSINAGIGRTLFRRTKRFSIYVGIGFNSGRTKIYQSKGFVKINPFFSPKLFIKPTVWLGKRLYLHLSIEYEYDVTRPIWLNSDGSSDNSKINSFKQSSFTGLIGLGVFFKKDK